MNEIQLQSCGTVTTTDNCTIDWIHPTTTTVPWVDITSYWTYQKDPIRDWLEGFLEGKSHLTNADVKRLREKLELI